MTRIFFIIEGCRAAIAINHFIKTMQLISFNGEFVKKNWKGALACCLVPFTGKSGLPGLKRGRQGRRPYHEGSRTGLRAGHQISNE